MRIIVQLDAHLASAMRRGLPEAMELNAVTTAFGCALQPVHPSVEALPLGGYFTGVVKARHGEDLLAALRVLRGVLGAYAKPEDAPA